MKRERKPTEDEVAEYLGWSVEGVRPTMGAMPDTTSLDQPAYHEEAATRLGDLIEDERASDTPGEVMRGMETAYLDEAIERLPERARCVLVRRYVLDERKLAMLAELGEELNISRERVRQLQSVAKRMLESGAACAVGPTTPNPGQVGGTPIARVGRDRTLHVGDGRGACVSAPYNSIVVGDGRSSSRPLGQYLWTTRMPRGK